MKIKKKRPGMAEFLENILWQYTDGRAVALDERTLYG